MKTVVNIVGRLTQDIEPVGKLNDKAVLSIGTNYRRGLVDKVTGVSDYVDEAVYFNVLLVGSDAAYALKHPSRKGQIVSVRAQIVNNAYKVEEKEIRGYNFLAQEVNFLEAANKEEE